MRYNCINMKENLKEKQKIESYITSRKIVTLEEIGKILNSKIRITIFRKLKKLSYLSSYSHKGKYYTLSTLPKFSEEGLWCYNSVYFSKYDTLINTCYHFVNNSESGFSVSELQAKLHIQVKLSLLTLYKKGKLYREKSNGIYVYFNKDFDWCKQQVIFRKSQNSNTHLNIGKLNNQVITAELKAAIVLFYSVLNEKQRRLFAGLESLKIGYGGDKLISSFLNISPETVSKGRSELVFGNFEKNKIRKKGGGRPSIKKKIPKL